MNTRAAAQEYRIQQWTKHLRDRKESGLSITAWCEVNGYSRNTYFYWQRKLRETVCELAAEVPRIVPTGTLAPNGWAMCETTAPEGKCKALTIEIGTYRVNAEADTDLELLGKVCRVLASLC
jgi:putative transposase